jgi:hypothetical protein
MADLNGKETVGLTTKWFGLNLSGPNAGNIFLFLIILGLIGFTYWQNIQRSVEHDAIICMIKLNLYMQTLPSDRPMDWRRMPVDTFSCVPKFIYEKDSETLRH